MRAEALPWPLILRAVVFTIFKNKEKENTYGTARLRHLFAFFLAAAALPFFVLP